MGAFRGEMFYERTSRATGCLLDGFVDLLGGIQYIVYLLYFGILKSVYVMNYHPR